MQSGKSIIYLSDPTRLVLPGDGPLYAAKVLRRTAEMRYLFRCHGHLIDATWTNIEQRSRADAAD